MVRELANDWVQFENYWVEEALGGPREATPAREATLEGRRAAVGDGLDPRDVTELEAPPSNPMQDLKTCTTRNPLRRLASGLPGAFGINREILVRGCGSGFGKKVIVPRIELQTPCEPLLRPAEHGWHDGCGSDEIVSAIHSGRPRDTTRASALSTMSLWPVRAYVLKRMKEG